MTKPFAKIQPYIDAATAGVLDYLNLAAMPVPTPAPVTAAILLAVGDLYENRESKIDNRSVDNLTYKRLLDLLKLRECPSANGEKSNRWCRF